MEGGCAGAWMVLAPAKPQMASGVMEGRDGGDDGEDNERSASKDYGDGYDDRPGAKYNSCRGRNNKNCRLQAIRKRERDCALHHSSYNNMGSSRSSSGSSRLDGCYSPGRRYLCQRNSPQISLS